MNDSVHLYGFWRSLATYRVRIALALKGISYTETSINLLAGEQFEDEVSSLNPQCAVPVMLHQDSTLTQSLAILEYIEECYPEPSLLPSNALDRAGVRAFALISIADTHPLTVPRTRKQLAQRFNASDSDIQAWAAHWSKLGLQAMESRLQKREHDTRFCFSDEPGLADIALASQVTGAEFFGVTLDDFPVVATKMKLIVERDEFVSTSPETIKGYLNG